MKRYMLEMIFDNERPSYVQGRLALIRRVFPDVRELASSYCWVIAGCERDAPLTEQEKALLSNWREEKVVLRFRCKLLS